MDIRQLEIPFSRSQLWGLPTCCAISFISPQGLSKAIRQLENELGVALMEKVEENPAQQMPQLSWLPAALS